MGVATGCGCKEVYIGCKTFSPGKSFEPALVIDPAMGFYQKQKSIRTTHIIQHTKHHTMHHT